MTYSQWHTQYIQLYKRDLAPKTRESYDRLQGLLAPILGALALAAISPDDVQRALVAVADVAGTRQSQLAYALLHASLARAVKSRHLTFNPCDAVDRPRHDGAQGRAITGDDWTLLQPVIDDDLAFALMARAGLRRGEALALRWADIDLAGRLLSIDKQLLRVGGELRIAPPKSAAAVRRVPIEPELLAILRRSFRLAPTSRVVRCSPETLARRWRRAQEAAGIAQPYRLHDLRHTYATRYVAAGCNLRVLQYMIGHSSFELTASTYTHINANHAVSELDRVAASLH